MEPGQRVEQPAAFVSEFTDADFAAVAFFNISRLENHIQRKVFFEQRGVDGFDLPIVQTIGSAAGDSVGAAADPIRRICCATRYKPDANSSAVCMRCSGSFFSASSEG